MQPHEIDIEIDKDGRVRVHVKGAKGKACLKYAEFLEQMIGRIEDRELTAEYYEPEAKTRILPNLQGKLRREA